MNLSALVEHYGYAAVFVGALAEGESVLLAAGFAAHRGLLNLPVVVATAFIAATVGDQLWFHLGRTRGPWLLERFPSIESRARRLKPLLDRHPGLAVVALRFMYGLRTAGPAALGMLGVPSRTFTLFNALGAALWAVIVSGVGWQFGNAVQWLFDDLRSAEEVLLVGLFVAGIGFTAWRRCRARRQA